YPIINVPDGSCLMLTRKYGKEIPHERMQEGDFLAREGERGVVRDVLPPSSYRINPHAYDYKIVPAIEIKESQFGVRTLKVGPDPPDPADKAAKVKWRYVVTPGFRGVQSAPVPSGRHYINPAVESILTIGVQDHKVEFPDIVFPSRDGFLLKPHV